MADIPANDKRVIFIMEITHRRAKTTIPEAVMKFIALMADTIPHRATAPSHIVLLMATNQATARIIIHIRFTLQSRSLPVIDSMGRTIVRAAAAGAADSLSALRSVQLPEGFNFYLRSLCDETGVF